MRQCRRSADRPYLALAHVDGRARVGGLLQDKAYPWSRLREQPAQILRTTLFTTWEDGTSHLSVLRAARARPCSQLRFARGVITWRSARARRARVCVFVRICAAVASAPGPTGLVAATSAPGPTDVIDAGGLPDCRR